MILTYMITIEGETYLNDRIHYYSKNDIVCSNLEQCLRRCEQLKQDNEITHIKLFEVHPNALWRIHLFYKNSTTNKWKQTKTIAITNIGAQ